MTVPPQRKVIWESLPKQREALERPEFEIGFGGARGGGKTDAGLAWCLYDTDKPYFRGLVLRKNSTDLTDWIDRARRMFRKARLVNHPSPHFIFPSGAIWRCGHLKDDNSFAKYQGHEYHRILWEELEYVASEENYEKVLTSCRSTDPSIRAQSFATFNPGGPGHWWIKKRFGLSGMPKEPVVTKDEVTERYRVFIPSRVDDNPFLMENDPGYVKFLDGLPDGIRDQWRFGSWDDPVIKGAFFSKELRQAIREHRVGRVIYDPSKPVYTFWDIGVDDFTFIIFVQFIGERINVIHAYQNEGYGLQHYTKYVKERAATEKYEYAGHFFPHDIEQREFAGGEIPKVRKEVAEDELGPNVEVVERTSIADRIQAARTVWGRVWIDEESCGPLIDALRNWRQKWDDGKGAYTAIVKDWACHGADCFTYMAVEFGPEKREEKKKKEKSEFQHRGVERRPKEEEEIPEEYADVEGGVVSPFR